MGRNAPREELIAKTSVLAMEIPNALTPCPKKMAPNPQAKPVTTANTIALAGAARRTSRGAETVARAMMRDMPRQEDTMKIVQTFSHDQRPRNRIGSVKVPFIRPDTIARSIPNPHNGFNIAEYPISRWRLSVGLLHGLLSPRSCSPLEAARS